MKQYLDILERVLSDAEMDCGLFKTCFTTSADVVMRVSGLRLEAIRVIAREQGVEIEDTACRCIDENLLAALADAHVRKMKAYFNNAHRHLADLAGDELATYVDFCNTFKRRQSSKNAVTSWTDINEDTIREQFIEKVHQLTPSPCFDLFAGCSCDIEKIVSSLSIKPYENLKSFEYTQRDEVIEKILNSHLYYEKTSKLQQLNVDTRSVVRRITLPARYHIFTSEEDDHQQDTLDMLSINRAPAMVA